MTLDTTTLPTPVGPLTLIADGDALVAAGFSVDAPAMRARLAPARRSRELRAVDDLGAVSKAVSAYLDGDLTAIDDIPVDQAGTPHQVAIWRALRTIPAGETVTYGELASMAGSPSAVRAAGTACGRNLVALVVPCHRVVRAGGGLGGYAGGLPVKQWLLDHEAGRVSLAPRR